MCVCMCMYGCVYRRLDSVMAESVVWSLSELRRKGKLVVASVHCPSSEMLHLFSHLLLLTGDGRLAFHGPMTDALKHFEALGYQHTQPQRDRERTLLGEQRGVDHVGEWPLVWLPSDSPEASVADVSCACCCCCCCYCCGGVSVCVLWLLM